MTSVSPIVKISAEQTAEMAQCRWQEVERDFPDIKKEDFTSEEEYRKALLKTYEGLRAKEYEFTVQNECTKVYNLARDAKAAGVSENAGVWNGYHGYINAPKISEEEKQRRQEQVQNCAIARAPQMGKKCLGMSNFQGNSCAITAASLTAEISARMGYDGNDNLMISKFRGAKPSLQNNLVAAQGVARCDSIPQKYQITPKPVKQSSQKTAQKPTLNQMIANGTLGVGDAFSVPTGRGATNTSTGYHAMTIASVEKDEKGKVVGYTLQTNNSAHFSYHSIKETKSFGGQPVYNAVNTSNWMQDKIKQESQNLQNLSTAEIEAKIAATRQNTLITIAELEQTETYNATKGYAQNIAGLYTMNLEAKKQQLQQTPVPQTPEQQQTPVPEQNATQQTPVPEQNASQQTPVSEPENNLETSETATPTTAKTSETTYTPEERNALKAELKAQVPSPSPIANDFKQAPFVIHVGVDGSLKYIHEEDTRPVKEAMRQDAKDKGISVSQKNNEAPTNENQNTPSSPQTAAKQDALKNAPSMSVTELVQILNRGASRR